MSEIALDIIKKWEGYKAYPYQDAVGVWTIGYGTTEGVGPHSRPVTQDQAEQHIIREMVKIQVDIDTLVDVPLSENQNAALISFIYNLGVGNFRSSTLLRKLNKGNYYGAAREFDRWIYAGGKVLTGLINRRKDEANLFCSPPKPVV